MEKEMKRGEWSARRDARGDGRGMDSRLANCYCPSTYNTKEDAATMTSKQSIQLLLILSNQHDHECMKMIWATYLHLYGVVPKKRLIEYVYDADEDEYVYHDIAAW